MSNAFLLTWNPAKFSDWSDKEIAGYVKESSRSNSSSFRWSCSNSQKPARGDRAFLMKLGGKGRGVFASGWIVRGSYLGSQDDKFGPRKVDVEWDVFLDPRDSSALMNPTSLKGQHWTPENSGSSISPAIRNDLESLWLAHFTTLGREASPRSVPDTELAQPFELVGLEGQLVSKLINHRRRERSLRDAKLVKYRSDNACLKCEVCGFDFKLAFGVDYAEVHHVKPLSASTGAVLTRLEDLAVLCANCHRVAHMQPHKPKSLAELRAMRTALP